MRYILAIFIIYMIVPVVAQGAYHPDPDSASAPTAKEMAKIETCLQKNSGEKCIHIVADACEKIDANKSTAGQRICVDKEIDIWNNLLKRDYEKLLSHPQMTAEKAETLKKAQNAWKSFVSAKCGFESSHQDWGTMYLLYTISCTLTETARQEIWMHDWLYREYQNHNE